MNRFPVLTSADVIEALNLLRSGAEQIQFFLSPSTGSGSTIHGHVQRMMSSLERLRVEDEKFEWICTEDGPVLEKKPKYDGSIIDSVIAESDRFNGKLLVVLKWKK